MKLCISFFAILLITFTAMADTANRNDQSCSHFSGSWGGKCSNGLERNLFYTFFSCDSLGWTDNGSLFIPYYFGDRMTLERVIPKFGYELRTSKSYHWIDASQTHYRISTDETESFKNKKKTRTITEEVVSQQNKTTLFLEVTGELQENGIKSPFEYNCTLNKKIE